MLFISQDLYNGAPDQQQQRARSSYGRIRSGLSHQQQRQPDRTLRRRRWLLEWRPFDVSISAPTSTTISTATISSTTTTTNSVQLLSKVSINSKSSISLFTGITCTVTITFNILNFHSSNSVKHNSIVLALSTNQSALSAHDVHSTSSIICPSTYSSSAARHPSGHPSQNSPLFQRTRRNHPNDANVNEVLSSSNT